MWPKRISLAVVALLITILFSIFVSTLLGLWSIIITAPVGWTLGWYSGVLADRWHEATK